ncbi:MAG: AraC family transcriptional regulator ligand-binding domain-containing protein, partial [Pseudomonadota bacterium]
PTLEAEAFFRLWNALTQFMDTPTPGLVIGQSVRAEAFSPPMFAAFCSPNLKVAMERLSLFKPLLGPCRLEVAEDATSFEAVYSHEPGLVLPREYAAMEPVFLTSMARMATRADVRPLAVELIDPPAHNDYSAFFGVSVRRGAANRLVFSARDAERPFLSVNHGMYSVFEPELRLRLSELQAEVSLADRLRAALMEVMSSGRTGIGDVAPRLGMSARSLQRRLNEADTSYQAELTALRTRLAVDYLKNTAHSSAEISYLLGYSDPNSFVRAFGTWTGTTPEAMRRRERH